MDFSEKNLHELYAERNAREQLLKKHDYIASKIAMGRATIGDYAAEIAQSTQWAADINAIDGLIAAREAAGETDGM